MQKPRDEALFQARVNQAVQQKLGDMLISIAQLEVHIAMLEEDKARLEGELANARQPAEGAQ